TIILIWPAIKNGYPLLFSDSGTYLATGHSGEVPIDRPIIYGLFVRHISLSWSIWLVVIAQSLLFNYLLYLISKFIIKAKQPLTISTFIAIFLGLFTGVGYYAGQVVADIFTSISLVSAVLLIILDKKNVFHLTCLSIILIFSIITHLSHIPIVFMVICLIAIYFILKGQFKRKFGRLVLIGGLFGVSLLTISTINYSFGYGFIISRTNNIILATRYIESGLANKYLKKHCNSPDFNPPYKELCGYVDQFHQWPAAGFYLYSDNSPLYLGDCKSRGNWSTCWEERNEAYGVLIKDILSDDKLLIDFVALAFTGTLKQLITIEQSEMNPHDLRYIIEKYYEDDLYSYDSANQTSRDVIFVNKSVVEAILVFISFLILVYFIIKHKAKIDGNSYLLLIAIFSGLFFNAAFCATLSNVIPRYQGRIIFLIPMLAIIIIIVVFKDKIASERVSLSRIL
ncbi:MAG: hypothetical protein KDB74_01850, partial [Flavobacteriales bacterium]|nr:hypothetical protein [Flavobacteriales bacterium]